MVLPVRPDAPPRRGATFGRAARAAALALALPAGPAPAEVLALVIGVDRYAHVDDLRGAVNDALDIAEALAALPEAEVVMLLNEDATRERILGTWAGFADRARPGDTIVVSFAGHGSNEPARADRTEKDGRDETFLLSGFDPARPAAGERILDDEIAALVARRPDIPVIVVADSCHSGTATRATAFDLGSRFVDTGGRRAAPPSARQPLTRAAGGAPPPALTFFAAVGEDEKAPEIRIGGTVRGALSHAFAAGLRGAADFDGDGIVAKGELERHIAVFVKQATAGRQTPRVEPVGARDRPLFRVADGGGPVAPIPPFAQRFEDLPPLPVRSEGALDAGPILRTLDGVTLATAGDDGPATLVVDLDRRLIRSVQGDVLRRLFGRSEAGFRRQIQETADKFRAVRALQAAQIGGRLDIWFPLGDALYFADDPVRLMVDGRTGPHLSLFNITADATVEWLYPVTAADRTGTPPGAPLALEVFVLPPFGAEHLVAVETSDPQDAVLRALNRHAGGFDFRAFWTDMHHALRDRPHRVAVHAFFTHRPGDR